MLIRRIANIAKCANMLSYIKLMCLCLLTRSSYAEFGYQYPQPARQNFVTNFVTPIPPLYQAGYQLTQHEVNHNQPEDNYQQQQLAPEYGAQTPQEFGYPPQPEINVQPQPEYGYPAQTPNHVEYNKEFYGFEAPDSGEDAAEIEQHFSAALQKNLQVVFIKAPENKALEGAFHALAKQSVQDKTAIYVLNKQHSAADLANKVSALRLQHKSKPEVHFVKYRTPEEAQRAQLHIQAQYNGLPGSEQHYTGTKPIVLNYAGYTPSAAAGAPGYTGTSGYASATQAGYDPAPSAPTPSFDAIDLPEVGYNTASAAQLPLEGDYEQSSVAGDSFRINERHRPGARMLFPTELPPTRLNNAYLPPYRKRR